MKQLGGNPHFFSSKQPASRKSGGLRVPHRNSQPCCNKEVTKEHLRPETFSAQAGYTLPKTNIAPENGWLDDEISYWEGLFSGDMLVSQRVCLKYKFRKPGKKGSRGYDGYDMV